MIIRQADSAEFDFEVGSDMWCWKWVVGGMVEKGGAGPAWGAQLLISCEPADRVAVRLLERRAIDSAAHAHVKCECYMQL